MENREGPSLSRLCALHFASIIGNGRVPPIDTPLPTHIGDEIMDAMRQLSLLDLDGLKSFVQTPLTISKFDSSHCESISFESLLLLHKYKDLSSINIANHDKNEMSPFNCLDIVRFVNECLSEEAATKIRHLNIAGFNKVRSLNGFGKLPSLESLSLARRPLDARWMTNAAKFLPQLRSLDISDTAVNELNWVSSVPNLEVLVMHNLEIKYGDVRENLVSLSKLRVLDISKKISDYAQDGAQDTPNDLSSIFVDIVTLYDESPWPELRSLDIAGNALAGYGLDKAVTVVNQIAAKCPKIRLISVLATPLDSYSFDLGHVQVVNCSAKKSSMEALSFYWNSDRDGFTSHALHNVYYSLQSSYDEFTDEEVVRCAELVCNSMKKHLLNIGVQMAGSACLYHLCKLKRIRRLTSEIVQNCMSRCLDAAEAWRQIIQLQKNVWLTICNDYLLQLPCVDFYRTCKVALESMLTSKDSSVARMTIAIVSIVTPKMRPPEARELTSDERYVKFLVGMLNDTLRQLEHAPGPRPENSLFTLKFTLSALWNLTDESSVTCEVFYQSGGVKACFSILELYTDHMNIQTKVLGILNNIAEVDRLRNLLIDNNNCIQSLCECLKGDFKKIDENGRNRAVERSYFAAGVLSNLLTHKSLLGRSAVTNKDEIDKRLCEAVSLWPPLVGAMVSYRSFAPFERILNVAEFDGARLWCLWGVAHVLANKERQHGMSYSTMLKDSSILGIVEELRSRQDIAVDSKLGQLIAEIYEHVDED